jgi:Tfp pilus assembly protein PilX
MRQRLENESGIALVMAVGILAFLMITGSAVVFYAGSNTRSAEHSADNARALNAAEAGMNYARAILWNSSTPTSSSALPSSASPGQVTLEGTTVKYWGSYDTATKVWTLYGSGTDTNPTGGTAQVARQASSQVLVSSTAALDPAWGYLFADTTSCTLLQNSLEIDAPIYVRGDLCMKNSAMIVSDLVQVRGKVQIENSASIGTASVPVGQVYVGGGCRFPWSGSYVTPCGTAQKVYRTIFSSTVPNLTKPPLDPPLSYWYANAKPGPQAKICTTGSFPGSFDNDSTLNRSNGTQYLFTASAYDCQVKDGAGNVLGRIAYTPGTPGTFRLEGVVFFDGKLEFPGNRDVVYQGRGTIYATDEIKIQNHVRLCAVAACDTTWNPDVNLLAFVAGATSDKGFLIENNTTFQGAIYIVNDFHQENSVIVCGPVIAQELVISNNTENCYVPFTTGAPGMPGTSTATTTLTSVPGSFTTD